MGLFVFLPCAAVFPPGGSFRFLIAFLVLCCSSAGVSAQPLVNELYYDHPGKDDGFEFVELFNPSGNPVSLGGVAIEFHNGSGEGWVVLWSGDPADTIHAGVVFVVGGERVTPPPDAVYELRLQNGPDAIRVTVDGVVSDLLAYGGLETGEYTEGESAPPIAAGRSLARVPDGRDSDDNATDFRESVPSPGSYNVPRRDAALRLDPTTPAAGVLGTGARERLRIDIVNGGTLPIAAGAVTIQLRDSSAAGVETIAGPANRGAIGSDAAEPVEIDYDAGRGRHWLEARLSYEGDERAYNDTISLVRRVGGPDLLVSEVLSYPPDGCPQFVELYNAGAAAVELSGYGIRDRSHAPLTLTEEPRTLPPGRFLVATPDESLLARFFPSLPADGVLQPDGTWPTFNRSGSSEVSDSVVVVDDLGLPVDAVGYPPLARQDAGRSLERVDLYRRPGPARWVLSNDPSGATPGRMGGALVTPPPVGTVVVTPNPFSPYDGGSAAIAIDEPGAARVTVSVYDLGGRRLASLGSATGFPSVFVWEGRDDTGALVPPGLYLLACEFFSQPGQPLRVERMVLGCARRSG